MTDQPKPRAPGRRELHLDVSGWKRVRGRVQARVRVKSDTAWVADQLLHVDSDAERGAFWANLLSRLLLADAASGTDATYPNAYELDRRFLDLAAQAEVAEGGDTADQALEHFFVDADGNTALEMLVGSERVAGPTSIANFSAKITADITIDSGALQSREFELEAVVGGNRIVFTLPAKAFADMSWIAEKLGPTAIVRAGRKPLEQFREAVQRLSTNVERRLVFGRLGWTSYRGDWVFLHAQGALGRDGPVDGISVRVPPLLVRYTLPAPPVDPVPALRQTFALLERLPDAVGLPLFGTITSAALDEHISGLPSAFLLGGTGSFKSSLIAALLHLSGGPWTARSPLITWDSTANSLEYLASLVGQTANWVDDLRPAVTAAEHASVQLATTRVFRETVTRAGRARSSTDMSQRPIFIPRGPLLTSGERLPSGASTLARLLIVTALPLDLDALSLVQQQAPLCLPQVGAAWVCYLAARYDALGDLNARVEAEVQAARGRLPAIHAGLFHSLAALSVGWEQFLGFAQASGALDDIVAADWRRRMRQALDLVVQTTHLEVDIARPEAEYLETVRSLLEAGVLHVDGLPEFPTSGIDVGWYDATDDLVYLIASVADQHVGERYRTLHGGPPFPFADARRALRRRGLLVRTDPGRLTFKTGRPGGADRPRTLVLRRGTLLDG
jgi:hypothetical protein